MCGTGRGGCGLRRVGVWYRKGWVWPEEGGCVVQEGVGVAQGPPLHSAMPGVRLSMQYSADREQSLFDYWAQYGAHLEWRAPLTALTWLLCC